MVVKNKISLSHISGALAQQIFLGLKLSLQYCHQPGLEAQKVKNDCSTLYAKNKRKSTDSKAPHKI